jgi:hypothetical protein
MKKRIGSLGTWKLQGSVGANRKNHPSGMGEWQWQRQRRQRRQRQNRRTTSAEGVQLSRPQNGRNWGTESLGGQKQPAGSACRVPLQTPGSVLDKHGVPREGEPLVCDQLASARLRAGAGAEIGQ